MIYRPLLGVTAIGACALGLLLLLAPKVYLTLYVPSYSADMAFAAQRLAPAVIGLAALLWIARGLTAGAFSTQFTLIAACVWFGVAASGVFHFATGVATANILIAASLEVILGLLFLLASRQMRNA